MTGCLKYSVYIAAGSSHYRAGYTHDPSLDVGFFSSQGYKDIYLLTCPLVPGQAIPLYESISGEGGGKGTFAAGTLDQLLEGKIRELKGAARKFKIPAEVFQIKKAAVDSNGHRRIFEYAPVMEEVLRGRILFLTEIERLLYFKKLRLGVETEDVLHLLCLDNKCVRLPAIRPLGRNRFICSRCGQSDGVVPVACASCGGTCYHCENCLSMGESRFCQSLYAVPGQWDRSRLPVRQVEPKMLVSLSPAQENASRALRQFVLQPEQREKLVWAACGAGKTEVTFRAIAEALSRRQKVLFAIPRKDAVEEIVVRIRRAFPRISVVCLHGTSRERFSEAEVVVSTTHQVMRFYSSFGLVILDEIDAYPYNTSPMLQAGIMRARARGGKIIYMTATPSEELLKRHKKGELDCVWIPARYHGYPVPEPELVIEKRLPLMEAGDKIPESVINIIHETLEGDLAQLFIFVPTVETGFRIARLVEKVLKLPPFNNFEGGWVQFCHSRDGNREEKLAAFRKGSYPILVTTTICERGLTLPRVNVLVLFADRNKIFDSSALIQMAGRSGRSRDYPTGKVWFAGSRYTSEMKRARDIIKKMNRQAFEMGFLRPEAEFILERRGRC